MNVIRRVSKKTKSSDVEIVRDNVFKTLSHNDVIFMPESYVLRDGRVGSRNVLKPYNSVEELSKYRVSDFSLENLTSAGLTGGLKFMQFSDNNIDNSLLNMEKFMDEYDKITENIEK